MNAHGCICGHCPPPRELPDGYGTIEGLRDALTGARMGFAPDGNAVLFSGVVAELSQDGNRVVLVGDDGERRELPLTKRFLPEF